MFKTLLVPVDGSPTARLALAEAAKLATLSGARVVLLHVVNPLEHIRGHEPPAIYINDIRPRFLQEAREMLDAASAELRAAGVEAQTVLHESKGERVSEHIVDQAAQLGADMIILGTHGRRGVNRLLLGSDAEQVARLATVPVLLVRGK